MGVVARSIWMPTLWREGADMAAGGRAALLALAGLYEPSPDLDATADVLLTIWRRTLYGA